MAVTRFWDNLRQSLGFAPKAAQTPIIMRGPGYSTLALDLGGNPQLSERTAIAISGVYACVKLISGAIASMPMHVYRRYPDGERDRLQDDALWWLLNEQFGPRWTAVSGWEHMAWNLLLQGDAFAIIRRNPAGAIDRLEPVHSQRVSVGIVPETDALVYAVSHEAVGKRSGLNYEVVPQDDMLHVPGCGYDGYRGMSPLAHQLRVSGPAALASTEYSSRFFANGARPDFVLHSEATLSAETIDMMRAQIEERHAGSANSHRPMILSGGLKLQPVTMPLEEAQLLETRKYDLEEIARIYGVPPFMIGHNEKTTSWGSGVESMGTGFVRYTLRQHLTRFENEINRKFFRTAARFVEFDTTELERADTKSLFESFRIALGRAGEPGFMTVDEVRQRLNLKRMPGGDQLSMANNDGGDDEE